MGLNMTVDLSNAINEVVMICHSASQNAGWWAHYDAIEQLDTNPEMKEFLQISVHGSKYALMHSELSEGLEGLRKNLKDDKLPHRPMEEVELADNVIRAFDYAGKRGFDLGGAILEKLSFNAVRSDHNMNNRLADGGKKI